MNGHPRLYGWTQQIFTSSRCWKFFVESDLRPVPGERLLDLGCGTGLILNFLPPLDYWGLDSDPARIRLAQKKWGDRAHFICSDLSRVPWPVQGPFDRVTATGLLHHLADAEVLQVLNNVRKLLKTRAPFVTFDGCYEKQQSPFAHLLLSMDRGKYVRDEKSYTSLARSVFKHVESRIERRFLRVPYSHLIMEMKAE